MTTIDLATTGLDAVTTAPAVTVASSGTAETAPTLPAEEALVR